FSVDRGERVAFLQPNSNSVALNRVISNNVSNIDGPIDANGKVFLVNPNGVMFGPGAQINVGGLVASTRNISDADFLAGNYRFSGTSAAAIINQG
ncbi:two-partner secretion domain-containing protein, partial [Burkholderia sola]|uniref:two-partner secretion domain-containing protein n=1 Tax=Burkholderia sola TaxID=2843302 RepID=UPI0023DE0972